jgi:dihydrofolate reductase
MGKLVVSVFTSLDGYIEPESGFEGPAWSDDVERHWSLYALSRAKHLVYGRVNFEVMRGFWSQAETDPTSAAAGVSYAGTMNALPKTVFSRTLSGDPGWNGTLATEGIAETIARLKAEVDGDIFAFGGKGLIGALIAADVVDEIMMMVVPVLWAGGRRLFDGDYSRQALELIESRQLDTGSVILRYARTR